MENEKEKPQMEMKLKWWAKIWYYICFYSGCREFIIHPKMRYFVEYKPKFKA
jgi:hypothetical protein